jgi:hypothetical protein
LHFTGSADRVTVPYSSALDLGPQATVEIWVRPTSIAAGRIYEQSWVVAQQDKGLNAGADGSLGAHAWYGGTCNCSVQSTAPAGTLTAGMWHHVAFVYAPGGGALYFDGQLVADDPNYGDPSDAATPLYIGGSANGYPGQAYPPLPAYLWQMRISRIARYSGPFTPEVQPAADADTQALWRLDEGAGTTVLDAQGGPSGTVSGAVWEDVPCPPA